MHPESSQPLAVPHAPSRCRVRFASEASVEPRARSLRGSCRSSRRRPERPTSCGSGMPRARSTRPRLRPRLAKPRLQRRPVRASSGSTASRAAGLASWSSPRSTWRPRSTSSSSVDPSPSPQPTAPSRGAASSLSTSPTTSRWWSSSTPSRARRLRPRPSLLPWVRRSSPSGTPWPARTRTAIASPPGRPCASALAGRSTGLPRRASSATAATSTCRPTPP